MGTVAVAPSTPAAAAAAPGDRPLRIAFLVAGFSVGGTELNAVRTAEAMDRTRYPLQVLGMSREGPLASRYVAAGIPVVDFWSTRTDQSLDDLRAAVSGSGDGAGDIVVPADDADAIAAALGVTLGSEVQRLPIDGVRKQVGKGALGLLRVTDVDPSVRALSLDGVSLFGNDRVEDVSSWPLTIEGSGPSPWDQASTWTLVAGGDKNLHYLPGDKLIGDDGEGTVDGSHPTDLGFMRQADAFAEALKPLLAPKK